MMNVVSCLINNISILSGNKVYQVSTLVILISKQCYNDCSKKAEKIDI